MNLNKTLLTHALGLALTACEEREQKKKPEQSTEPDWTSECEVCGQTPIVPMTGLCGPCTFGEADTAGGNW